MRETERYGHEAMPSMLKGSFPPKRYLVIVVGDGFVGRKGAGNKLIDFKTSSR